jgi:hypothetical protein
MGEGNASELNAEALLELARKRGAGAALAARRAAVLAERGDPGLAQEALRLVAYLEPLDPQPRLALARMAAERGDLAGAAMEAKSVLADAVDQGARARAAFMIGEIARVRHDHDGARVAYRTTLTIEDALLAGDRSDVTAARWYARARGRLAELDAAAGQIGPARTGAEGALAMLRAAAAQAGEPPVLAADIADAEMRLAALELDGGQPASARRRLGEAIGRYEALAVTEKYEPHWRAVLSDAWALAAEADYVRGAKDAARSAMDKALQARIRLAANYPQEAWGLAGAWRLRAALRAALGDAEAAADSLQQARALAETLCAEANNADAPSRFLVHALLDQADHALRTGDPNRAREAADAARMRAEVFARKQEADPAWLAETAACWDRLGEVARAARAKVQTQEAFTRAVELRRMARDRAPEDPHYARGLAAALLKFGDAAKEGGAFASARAAFDESAVLRLDLLRAQPDDARTAKALAAALERVGLAAHAAGDALTARGAWEDELLLAERIFPPDDLDGARFRATVEAHLALLGGVNAETHRLAALAHYDVLAQAGLLTEQEAAQRRRLWGG